MPLIVPRCDELDKQKPPTLIHESRRPPFQEDKATLLIGLAFPSGGFSQRHLGIQDKDTRYVLVSREMIPQVNRHRSAVIRNQYKIMRGAPTQNLWIKRTVCRRSGIPYTPDQNVRRGSFQGFSQARIHVFIQQILDGVHVTLLPVGWSGETFAVQRGYAAI